MVEKQLVTIFVENLNKEIGFHLQLQCENSFDEIIDKGLTIVKVLITKGLVKIYEDHQDNKN